MDLQAEMGLDPPVLTWPARLDNSTNALATAACDCGLQQSTARGQLKCSMVLDAQACMGLMPSRHHMSCCSSADTQKLMELQAAPTCHVQCPRGETCTLQ